METLAYDTECVYQKLSGNDLDAAVKESDWKTFNFLHKDLIPEQIEEEKLSRAVLKLISCDTDWFTKQDNVLELYGK